MIARLLSGAAVLIVAGATAVATPAAQTGIATQLTEALKVPGVQLGRTAAYAIDLSNGRVIYAHNATRPVVPASNEKLPVAWAALTRLGPDFRFHTDVVGSGTRKGAVWRGNLVLKGYGDPTLAGRDIESLARTIAARGLRRVQGRVLGDESFFDARRDAPGWKRGFLGLESPPLSALVLDRAAGWPKHSPPLLAAEALVDALARRKVVVTGRVGAGVAPADGQVLAHDESAPLVEVVRFLDRHSDNFTAEMLAKQLGTVDGGRGTTAGGLSVVTAELEKAGIPTAGIVLADGSGLSSLDRLTARTLAGTLAAGLADPRIAPAFVGSLAVAGGDGTLERRLTPLGARVKGKTGTTDLSCSLSGLVDKRIAFVVIQNGNPVSAWAARSAQDRFVTVLAAHSG